ncbi:MAG: hypothetical protein KAU07_02785 [Candidatus Andersenbacteria bacterium]|nr:hypothetical protein [Candidatus Andersenbacteria bacterium]
MSDIIQKLNTLKDIQPSEKLVVEMREEVLSKAPVFCNLEHNYNKKSIFDLSLNNFFASKMAVSFVAVIFVLFGGFSASYASKSSLPGDTLYPVKIASENVVLAIASEDKKAEVEIKQVDKRVEEFAKISQNYSDPKQEEKMEMLLGKIETGTNKAGEGLMEIKDSGVKAKVAKIINIKTEKNTEVLIKTNENLPDIFNDGFSEKLSSAVDSNKKVNLDSLAIRVEVMTDDDKDEITAIVKEKVEEDAVLSEEEKVVKIEKVDIDCLVCEESERDCLEEVDEEGNIRCYFEMISETTENIVETEFFSDEVDSSPRSNSDDTSNTEQDSDTSEDAVETEQCSAPATATPTIEEEKEVLINLLDNLNSDSDDTADEVITDEVSSDEDEGEVKGDTDTEDEVVESI